MADSQNPNPKFTLLLAAMIFNIVAVFANIGFIFIDYLPGASTWSEGFVELIGTFWGLLALAVGGVSILAIVLWVQNPMANKRKAIITIAAGILYMIIFAGFLLYSFSIEEIIQIIIED